MSTNAERIEDRIQSSRHALSDTLDALSSKLSPGQVVDELLGLAKGQAGTFTANLGRQVRDNPMPAVLIGAGIAMLAMSGRKTSSHRKLNGAAQADDIRRQRLEQARAGVVRGADEDEDMFANRLHDIDRSALNLEPLADEAAETFKARVKQTVSDIQTSAKKVTGKLSSTVDDVSSFASRQAENLSRGASSAADKGKEIYSESPLAIGALALAIGATIGAFAPLSELERDGLSGVARKAASVGDELGQQVSPMVGKVMDAVH